MDWTNFDVSRTGAETEKIYFYHKAHEEHEGIQEAQVAIHSTTAAFLGVLGVLRG